MAQWNTGDVITAEKLNQSSILLVELVAEEMAPGLMMVRSTKTLNEIIQAGTAVFYYNGFDLLNAIENNGEGFDVYTMDENALLCENLDDYPFFIVENQPTPTPIS